MEQEHLRHVDREDFVVGAFQHQVAMLDEVQHQLGVQKAPFAQRLHMGAELLLRRRVKPAVQRHVAAQCRAGLKAVVDVLLHVSYHSVVAAPHPAAAAGAVDDDVVEGQGTYDVLQHCLTHHHQLQPRWELASVAHQEGRYRVPVVGLVELGLIQGIHQNQAAVGHDFAVVFQHPEGLEDSSHKSDGRILNTLPQTQHVLQLRILSQKVQNRLASSWIWTSCPPHRVTSGQITF